MAFSIAVLAAGGRLIFVAGALGVLGVILLTGSSESDDETAVFAAPAECLDSWNGDRQAVGLAQAVAQCSCAAPERTVPHDCQVIRRITAVIARPMIGSAMSSPSATTTAEATTPRLT